MEPLGWELFFGTSPWAMDADALRRLLEQPPDWEAVAARIGKPMDGRARSVQNHNGVAVMDIRGPLFRYRSIFTWLLGGTAIEDASYGLHAALDDPTVRTIVLAINSPGGQIDGINEFADMIRAANEQKPIVAYVDGLAGSGAYWLAAAAGRIVADETSQLGSIGVRTTVYDERAADEKAGVKKFEIVSSQSPLKVIDPASTEGRSTLQQMVDALAQVFIGKVAQFRGTSEEAVMNGFGRGAMLLARPAVEAGMADALGSLEAVLKGESPLAPVMDRQMRDNPAMRVAAPAPPCDDGLLEHCGEDDEDEEDESQGTDQDPDDSSIPQGGIDLMTPTEDRQRIAAILTCEEATGREQLARTLALETDHSLDAAKKLLAAAPLAAAARPNALEQRMSQIQNPKVGVTDPDSAQDQTAAAEVQKILAYVPKSRLRAQVN